MRIKLKKMKKKKNKNIRKKKITNSKNKIIINEKKKNKNKLICYKEINNNNRNIFKQHFIETEEFNNSSITKKKAEKRIKSINIKPNNENLRKKKK